MNTVCLCVIYFHKFGLKFLFLELFLKRRPIKYWDIPSKPCTQDLYFLIFILFCKVRLQEITCCNVGFWSIVNEMEHVQWSLNSA